MLAPPLSEADYCLHEDAEKLEAGASKDPEEEPHKSRYAAQKLWLELVENLNNTLAQLGDSNSVRGILAGVYLKLAKNVTQCEERERGREYCLKGLTYLTKAEDILDDPLETELALSEETVHSYVSLLNYLGYLNESMGDHDFALKWLRDSETVFNAYKIQQEAPPPHNLASTMKQIGAQFASNVEYSGDAECSDALWKAFESLHTYTLYYLAQVYKNLGDVIVAAEYCEKTLVRQLEMNEYEPLEWSLNCATLSQFYLGKTTTWNQKNFAQARHCLAAAEAVAETIPLPAADDEYAVEKVEQCRADVNRCWLKYGIGLLETSQQSFLYENDPEDLKKEQGKEMPPNFDDSLAEIDPLFPNLNIGTREAVISVDRVSNFDSARAVFLQVQRWLANAQKFYTLDSHATDAVELVQDQSRLYKALVFFEPAIDRKAKMHKRRIDALSHVLQELNPSYYLTLCRQLLFELAETSNEMVSLKLDALEESGQELPTEHQAAKINILANQGIAYFERFIRTFDKPDGTVPEKFPSDAVRPIVLAHFYIGRLQGKKITDDPKEKLANLAIGLEHYRWIVKYCEVTDPSCQESIKEELDACRDMANLLPLKMARVQDLIQD